MDEEYLQTRILKFEITESVSSKWPRESKLAEYFVIPDN